MSKRLDWIAQHYTRSEGPFEEKERYNLPHVTVCPDEIYARYNDHLPDIGCFIPFGFYETEDQFKHRKEEIEQGTTSWTIEDFQFIIQDFYLPHTFYNCYTEWEQTEVRPRLFQLLQRRASYSEYRQFLQNHLIETGWDPYQTWHCEPPIVPEEDLKEVMNWIWDHLNHSIYTRIQNEYLDLFRNHTRIVQFINWVDHSIHRRTDSREEFLIDREKTLIAHLVWLTKVDQNVFLYYRQKAREKVNHHLGAAMPINDPHMTEQDRIDRDLFLDVQPVKGKRLDQMVGHNRIRASLVEESVPSSDYSDARDQRRDRFLRKENHYMEEYLQRRYLQQLDHLNQDELASARGSLPTLLTERVHEVYAQFDQALEETVLLLVHDVYQRECLKHDTTRTKAIQSCMDFIQDLYPSAIRMYNKLDPDNTDHQIHPEDLNLVGAIRVLLSNDQAKEDFYQMARAFGSQNPKYNFQIQDRLIEIASDTMNHIHYQKDPNPFPDKEQSPRDPDNKVEQYFCREDKSNQHHYDVPTNQHSDAAKTRVHFTPQQEEEQRKRIYREEADRRREWMRRYGKGGLNKALEEYLGELDPSPMNYAKQSGRDLQKQSIRDKEEARDKKELERMKSHYHLEDLGKPKEENEVVSLMDATTQDMTNLVNQYFTNKGKSYMSRMLGRFDLEAKDEYDEVEKATMLKDRDNFLRYLIMDIINTDDPLYIKDGRGKPGSFEPDLISYTKQELIDHIKDMSEEELKVFIEDEFDETTVQALIDKSQEGASMDDIRTFLIGHVDDVMQQMSVFDAFEDEEDDSVDHDKLYQLAEKVMKMSESELSETIDTLADEDAAELQKLFRTDESVNNIITKSELIALVAKEYDVDDFLGEESPAATEIPSPATNSPEEELLNLLNQMDRADLLTFIQILQPEDTAKFLGIIAQSSDQDLPDVKKAIVQFISTEYDPEKAIEAVSGNSTSDIDLPDEDIVAFSADPHPEPKIVMDEPEEVFRSDIADVSNEVVFKSAVPVQEEDSGQPLAPRDLIQRMVQKAVDDLKEENLADLGRSEFYQYCQDHIRNINMAEVQEAVEGTELYFYKFKIATQKLLKDGKLKRREDDNESETESETQDSTQIPGLARLAGRSVSSIPEEDEKETDEERAAWLHRFMGSL